MGFIDIKKYALAQLSPEQVIGGETIFNEGDCLILSQSAVSIDFLIKTADKNKYIEYSLLPDSDEDNVFKLSPAQNGKPGEWNQYSYACLLQYEQELSVHAPKTRSVYKKYTRKGMIKRVLDERRQKADKASYRIKWADNIYGDHILTNEQGVEYKIFLRDFEAETGYSDSWDSRLNKLGTTKH